MPPTPRRRWLPSCRSACSCSACRPTPRRPTDGRVAGQRAVVQRAVIAPRRLVLSRVAGQRAVVQRATRRPAAGSQPSCRSACSCSACRQLAPPARPRWKPSCRSARSWRRTALVDSHHTPPPLPLSSAGSLARTPRGPVGQGETGQTRPRWPDTRIESHCHRWSCRAWKPWMTVNRCAVDAPHRHRLGHRHAIGHGAIHHRARRSAYTPLVTSTSAPPVAASTASWMLVAAVAQRCRAPPGWRCQPRHNGPAGAATCTVTVALTPVGIGSRCRPASTTDIVPPRRPTRARRTADCSRRFRRQTPIRWQWSRPSITAVRFTGTPRPRSYRPPMRSRSRTQ